MLAAVEDGRERAAWTWILDRMEAYPDDKRIQPLRPPTRPEKPRRMVAAHFDTTGDL